jgi:hypothetical protein
MFVVNHASIFSCKATTKYFREPKNGRRPDVDAAVLNVLKEIRANGMPITRHVLQVKVTETA